MGRNEVIQSSKEILGGTAVFKGTRVPVSTIIDYLEAGDRIDDFLEDFPTVTRTQAIEVLHNARESLESAGDETAA